MSVVYTFKRGNWFQGHSGPRAGMVSNRVRLGEKSERFRLPGVSESRALGGTSDPETILPSVFFLSEV